VIARLGRSADEHFGGLKERLRQRLGGDDPVQLLGYRGYGDDDSFFVRGRLLAGRPVAAAQDNDTLWENLAAMYQRFQTREVAGAPVQVAFRDATQDTVTDDEGYVGCSLALTTPPAPTERWHRVTLTLRERVDGVQVGDGGRGAAPKGPPPQGAPRQPAVATAEILTPPVQCAFGVISDIDDTIVVSHATNFLKMARVLFLGNARTRLPFAGVAAFYRALEQGAANGRASGGPNPFFYVSSSPWNVYDLLSDFMDLQGIPRGPLLLRDYDLDHRRLLHFSHRDYKLAHIRHVLDTYPHLPFLLIGDSGQEDPEIYRQVVQEYPGRIQAVYVRDVAGKARSAEVQALLNAAQNEHVAMLLAPDTVGAARHAAERGWISPALLASIEEEKHFDDQPPSDLEQLLDEG
jgi:phosphatidate phosphatase APP1